MITEGIAICLDFKDKYEFQRLVSKFEEELLPAFAKVIAKKTEEYLKKLGY